ncbi:xylose isomerase-like protein [Coniochaeta sp. 2T2.1]|nr:xylose isomerase-like protein [Coniochaeta sp. 2T2.1]
MSLRPAIATVSLGRASAGHTLFRKLEEAAKQSFEGVELFYECLEHHAEVLPGGLNEDNLLLAAEQTRQECDRLNLEIVSLQPFLFSEGLVNARTHQKIIEKLKFWFQLAKILRTDLIQMPTNFLQEGTTGDIDRIVSDLTEFARLGLEQSPVIRFAYEGLAWGTHIDTWEGTWDMVKRVDLPNFGLCLDTFHIAGRVWADPTSPTGRNINSDADLVASLHKMKEDLDIGKVFYIQVGDAQKLISPLKPGNDMYVADQPERMTWSRNARLFPFETDRGAYLPVTELLDVLINGKGYRGWVSFEAFSSELFARDSSIPKQWMQRAKGSWDMLMKVYG